jgi:hypothetical protein
MFSASCKLSCQRLKKFRLPLPHLGRWKETTKEIFRPYDYRRLLPSTLLSFEMPFCQGIILKITVHNYTSLLPTTT